MVLATKMLEAFREALSPLVFNDADNPILCAHADLGHIDFTRLPDRGEEEPGAAFGHGEQQLVIFAIGPQLSIWMHRYGLRVQLNATLARLRDLRRCVGQAI